MQSRVGNCQATSAACGLDAAWMLRISFYSQSPLVTCAVHADALKPRQNGDPIEVKSWKAENVNICHGPLSHLKKAESIALSFWTRFQRPNLSEHTKLQERKLLTTFNVPFTIANTA